MTTPRLPASKMCMTPRLPRHRRRRLLTRHVTLLSCFVVATVWPVLVGLRAPQMRDFDPQLVREQEEEHQTFQREHPALASLLLLARRWSNPAGGGGGSGSEAEEATQLLLMIAPGRVSWSGEVLVAPAVVNLVDDLGNVVFESGVAVTAHLSSGAGVLTGTKTQVTGLSGRAVFDDLVIIGLGAHTITFTVAGLPFVVNHTVNVYTPNAPTILTDTGNAATNWTNLQNALNTAVANDRIICPANVQSDGTQQLLVPAFGGAGMIVVESAGWDTIFGLVGYGRMDPAVHGSYLTRLKNIGTATTGQDVMLVMSYATGAHDWIFRGFDISRKTISQTAPWLVDEQGSGKIGNKFIHCFLHPEERTQSTQNTAMIVGVERGGYYNSMNFIGCDMSGFGPKSVGDFANTSMAIGLINSTEIVAAWDCKVQGGYTSFFLGGASLTSAYSNTITAAAGDTITMTGTPKPVVGDYISMETGFATVFSETFTGEVIDVTGDVVTFIRKDHLVTGGTPLAPYVGGTVEWRATGSTVGTGVIQSGSDVDTLILSSSTGLSVGKQLVGPNVATYGGSVWQVTGGSHPNWDVTHVGWGTQKFFTTPKVGGVVQWGAPRLPLSFRIIKCDLSIPDEWLSLRLRAYEIKQASEVYIDGIVLRNGGTQQLSYPSNQAGTSPTACVRNVHVSNVFSTKGTLFVVNHDDGYRITDSHSNDFDIYNILIDDPDGVSPLFLGDGNRLRLRFRHISHISQGSFLSGSQGTGVDFVIADAIVNENYSPLCSLPTGSYSPSPLADCFNGATFRSLTMVSTDGPPNSYGAGESGTIAKTSLSGVGYRNFAAHDYQLATSSSSYQTASDGKDRGALLREMYAAMNPNDWPATSPVPS